MVSYYDFQKAVELTRQIINREKNKFCKTIRVVKR